MSLISKKKVIELSILLQSELKDLIKYRALDGTIKQLENQIFNCYVLLVLKELPRSLENDIMSKKDIRGILSNLESDKRYYQDYGIILEPRHLHMTKLLNEDRHFFLRNKFSAVPFDGDYISYKGDISSESFEEVLWHNMNTSWVPWYYLCSMRVVWVAHGTSWLNSKEYVKYQLDLSYYLEERLKKFYNGIQEVGAKYMTEQATQRVLPSNVILTSQKLFGPDTDRGTLLSLEWMSQGPNAISLEYE